MARLAACLAILSVAATAQRLTGIVRDGSGAPVAGASVTLKTGDGEFHATSSATGTFAFATAAPPAQITVEKTGFAVASLAWNGASGVRVALQPATVLQQVVVTATRTQAALGEVAATVSRLGAPEIAATPALALDDVLRTVPGFSLFRRSNSRTANPTSQGVSLRGLGASGASRALVLYDGVPLNDPFGGWVYWDRVPAGDIRSVEVLRGGASSLYGSGAIAGLINIAAPAPTARAVSLDTSAGTLGTRFADVTLTEQRAGWGFSGAIEGFESDGYVPAAPEIRGAADAPANLRYGAGDLRITRDFSGGSVFAAGNLFNESRQNGTRLQTNSTRLAETIAGADLSAGGGALSLRAYGSGQRFNQTFSSIAADRNSESLVRAQAVPSQQAGASAQWVRPLSSANAVVIGADLRQVRGVSDETIFTRSAPSSHIVAGGRQLLAGVFAEDLWRVAPRVHLTAAVRGDVWRNYSALSTTLPLPAGAAQQQRFADRTRAALSPSLGAGVSVSPLVTVSASGYGAFRAPTLNELYRAFRLGNVQTLANDNLSAERLWGGEAGVVIGSGPVFARATVFSETMHDAVGNRTLSTTPLLITRQRQNIGTVEARGFEFETRTRLASRGWLSASYEYAHSIVARSLDAALIGLRVPQVPRHATSFMAGYDARRWSGSVAGRYLGLQFDDDLDRFPLPGYFSADAMVRYRIGERVEAYASAENLLNRTYAIALTPSENIGAPRLVRAGVRLRWVAKP